VVGLRAVPADREELMDPELKEYLDKQREYLDEKFKSIDERFTGIDERFTGIDKRFDGIDKRFDGIDKRFEGIDKRFEGLEADVRQTRVVVEGLEGKIQLVAEGVLTVDAKLERYHEELTKKIEEVRTEGRLLYSQHKPPAKKARSAKKALKSA
jgi:archaellum component FlaC